MKILQAVKKIPGGLMVVPLLLGAIVNASFGGASWSTFNGTLTVYLWRSGAVPILAVFIFCNATTINFKKVGVTAYKGALITAVEVGVDIIIGLTYGTLSKEKGFLDLSTPATVGVLANSNGELYAALTGEYGDVTDVDAVSIPSINDGPFSIMIALGTAGVAKIPISTLIGYIILVTVGCILGDLDEDIHRFCGSGTTMLTPFFALPLGAELNITNLLRTRDTGTLLGVACTLIISPAGYLVYKLLRMSRPGVGGVTGTTVGDAVVTPASAVAVDATLLAVTEVTTTQITAAITVTAILYPVLVFYPHKIEVRKRRR